MIFIQIAAYRDPELLPTIRDCLENARHKADLRFGICWQCDPADDDLVSLAGDARFRVDRVPWQESRGLCWARSRIQTMYEGEDYTLQLDSHHRFSRGWDEELIRLVELTGSPKPILTSYAGVYSPDGPSNLPETPPFKMVAQHFTPSGTILFRPQTIEEWKDLHQPVKARFVSGHYFFTIGAHCHEYRYDPQLYFAGDEISLSIRSFSLGYDLYHPHRTLLWHEYTRAGRVKHWDDHVTANRASVGMAWHERDDISKRRLRKLLREETNESDLTGYDLGAVRSHAEYERYAGIDFEKRALHRDTVLGVEPPCRYEDGVDWSASFTSNFNLTLRWDAEHLKQGEEYAFVYFGIEDSAGKVLFRHDAPGATPEATGARNTMGISFAACSQPAKLVVWPMSKTRGWTNKREYRL